MITGPPGAGKWTPAEVAGRPLAARVLSWDWAMAALRPIAPIQAVIERLDHVGHAGSGGQREEGRAREIPGWSDVEWNDVAGFLDRWEPLAGTDLYLDTSAPPGACASRLSGLWMTPPGPLRLEGPESGRHDPPRQAGQPPMAS